jgi:hypothetical protein
VRLVDKRGRVAGRVNLVDAFVAMVILVLIPLAYGAYLLFRTPPAKLVRVSPARLFEAHNQRVEIEGTNLRPFMRVSFNTTQAKAFFIGSKTYALVDVQDLKPGTYDVVLFDYAQEVDRLPKALTVVPMVTDVEVEVVGAFKSPPEGLAVPVKPGDKFPPDADPVAEVVAVGASVPGDLRLRIGDETVRVPVSRRDVPATLLMRCYTARQPDGTVRCLVPGPGEPTALAPDALITLRSAGGDISFQVASVRTPTATATPAPASGAALPENR